MRKSTRKSFGRWGLLPLLAGVPALLAGLSAPANADNWQIGDVFAGISGGLYAVFDNNGAFVETINDGLGGFTTGCAFNNDKSLLYTTNFSASKIVVYDVIHPHAIPLVITTGGVIAGTTSSQLESIVFRADGSFTAGHAGGDFDLQEYDNTDAFVQKHNLAVGPRGTDWHDTASDQRTVYYTSEGNLVRTWDLITKVNGADFSAALNGGPSYALRLLPPGDAIASGGMLVANTVNVKRLNGAGAVSQTYDQAGENQWFALNLDPNNTSFWAGSFDTNRFYRLNITTGALEVGPIASGGSLFGLCVLGEPTAAVPTDIEVMIDIKFLSDPNGFNCKKKGGLPVLIFGTDDLDVRDIDVSTLRLELAGNGSQVGPPTLRKVSAGGPFEDRGDPDTDKGIDAAAGNPDGFEDLSVSFDSRDIAALIGCNGLNKGDTSPTLVLVGNLNDGTSIFSVALDDLGIDQLAIKNN